MILAIARRVLQAVVVACVRALIIAEYLLLLGLVVE